MKTLVCELLLKSSKFFFFGGGGWGSGQSVQLPLFLFGSLRHLTPFFSRNTKIMLNSVILSEQGGFHIPDIIKLHSLWKSYSRSSVHHRSVVTKDNFNVTQNMHSKCTIVHHGREWELFFLTLKMRDIISKGRPTCDRVTSLGAMLNAKHRAWIMTTLIIDFFFSRNFPQHNSPISSVIALPLPCRLPRLPCIILTSANANGGSNWSKKDGSPEFPRAISDGNHWAGVLSSNAGLYNRNIPNSFSG